MKKINKSANTAIMTFPFIIPLFSLWQVEASPVEGISNTKRKNSLAAALVLQYIP
jgi:hypothetical protein